MTTKYAIYHRNGWRAYVTFVDGCYQTWYGYNQYWMSEEEQVWLGIDVPRMTEAQFVASVQDNKALTLTKTE